MSIKKCIIFVLLLLIIGLSSDAESLTKEEINELRQIIREELQHVNRQIDDMNNRINDMNNRTDDMNNRIDDINKRLNHIDILLAAIIALNGAMVGSVIWLAKQDRPIGKIHYEKILRREDEIEEEIRAIKKTIENLKLQKI